MKAPRSDDLETAALHDLVERMRRFRRRVGAMCGGPIALVGAAFYVVSRGRLRSAWREPHRRNGVSEAWLASNSRRFG